MSTISHYATVTVSQTEPVITATLGVPGPAGPAGPAGPPGEDGEPGPAGVVWQGNYDPLIAYSSADAVYYDGETYLATADIPAGTTPPGGDWEILVGISPELQSLVDQAAASATAAATSEINAADSADAAALSASNAASSESAAGTSETNAANSAAAAASSETSAATSASNAADSASAAASSESNAAASESTAVAAKDDAVAAKDDAVAAKNATENIFDTFDDRFLGSFASDPTTDNDGNPLVAGAVYYNTTTKEVYFYNGATWDAPAAQAETSATNALTSENAAASSASAAATSETNAAGSASAALTSADNAAASESAAATSASDAASSATAAANSSSDAATSAANAADSATAAATSETNAATSASAAATSASDAASSASAASDSATAAATSESNAASSAADAAASYDAFDDRYLGSKASGPTTDNDGDALLTGALYWNTSDAQLYIWSGSAWEQAAFSASGTVVSFNGRDGAVTLASSDVTSALGYTPQDESTAFSGNYADLSGSPTISGFGETLIDDADALTARTTLGLGSAAMTDSSAYATSAQGDLADTAVQPSDLATVATTGAYTDITGTPIISAFGESLVDDADAATARTTLGLGSAALSSDTDFATAAQGTLADSAVQPADLATVATTGSYTDLSDTPTITVFAQTLLDDADAATARTTLELGSAATTESSAYATAAQGDLADTATQPADLATVATTGAYSDLSGTPTISAFGETLIDDTDAASARTTLELGTAATTDASAYATAAEGDLANTAVQPGDLATVATSGAYADLSGTPTISAYGATLIDDLDATAARGTLGLGTAATTASIEYATAAQGDLADTALQPGDLAAVATSGAYADLSGTPTITTFGESLIDDVDAPAARTTLGLGSAATTDSGDYATAAEGDLANTAVQPADLAAVATTGAYTDLTGTPTISTFGATLIDDADAATARTTLGLGTAATTAASDYATAAQGDLADTAVQSADLAAVATSGAYSDLTGAPSISTFGESLIDDADAGAARSTLGLANSATRTYTISTGTPSGGTDGDVWYQVS